MKAKFGILGCGNPSQKWHLPTMHTLAKHGELDFVALCDMNESLAKQTGETYGVPRYTSVEQMLEKHPDIMAVDVIAGDPTHHVLGRLIAEHGKHVMVEKPMALSPRKSLIIIHKIQIRPPSTRRSPVSTRRRHFLSIKGCHMASTEKFEERIVRVEKPSFHFTLLRTEKGDFLGVSEGQTAVFDHVDDKAIWKEEGDTYRHEVSGLTLDVSAANDKGVHLALNEKSLGEDGSESSVPAIFQLGHGPAHLPSEYLHQIRDNGWVCLPSILSPNAIEELQRVSCTGKWNHEELDRSLPTLTQSIEVSRAATEPVTLWVMRQYMQCQEIRLAHRPGFAVVPPDDGERKVGAWHSDYPYLWGIAKNSSDGNRIVPHNAPNLVLGVQRNLCVTEFKSENGATCFKLGSHTLGQGPPLEWGIGNAYREEESRKTKGLPYTGPEADVVEAPPGSYIIYDSRTWHRAGVNRTNKKRAAMLQSVVPMYIMPFMETSRPYKEFLAGPLESQLTEREHMELESLLVSRIDGPQGRFAITMDEELSNGGLP